MRTLLTSTLLLLSLMALPVATAGAATPAKARIVPLTTAPPGATFLGSDGAHRIAYGTGDAWGSVTTITVLDLATGGTVAVDLPEAACTYSASPGGLGAACVSHELTDPPDPYHAYVRPWDAATWIRTPPPFPRYQYDADTLRLEGIGRAWLRFVAAGYHWPYHTFYVDRAGGRRVDDDSLSATTVASLDAPGGTRALCRPLQRSPQDAHSAYIAADTWAAFRYAKPWAIDGPALYDAFPDGTSRTVTRLLRCGTRKAVTLCRTLCRDAGLTTRLATWSAGDVGYVRDLRRGTTTTVRVAGSRVTLALVGTRVVTIVNAPGGRVLLGRLAR